ncbi:hypothetical protein BMI88_01620 [Thioclava sp. F36-6]|nr:hypothetical protein BMI88_01620 [Thioclava sp. F36-6]
MGNAIEQALIFCEIRALRECTMASFERAGWDELVPYPVDYRADGILDDIDWDLAGHLDTLDLAIKEWVGIWAYAASGR